jgi:hypothetical protein
VSPAGATASELSEVAARHGGLDVAVQGDTLTMRLVDPERETPAVVAALVGAGAAILSVQDDEQPLEEVYIRLLAQQGAPAWH